MEVPSSVLVHLLIQQKYQNSVVQAFVSARWCDGFFKCRNMLCGYICLRKYFVQPFFVTYQFFSGKKCTSFVDQHSEDNLKPHCWEKSIFLFDNLLLMNSYYPLFCWTLDGTAWRLLTVSWYTFYFNKNIKIWLKDEAVWTFANKPMLTFYSYICTQIRTSHTQTSFLHWFP